jgi:hypothetical protein
MDKVRSDAMLKRVNGLQRKRCLALIAPGVTCNENFSVRPVLAHLQSTQQLGGKVVRTGECQLAYSNIRVCPCNIASYSRTIAISEVLSPEGCTEPVCPAVRGYSCHPLP